MSSTIFSATSEIVAALQQDISADSFDAKVGDLVEDILGHSFFVADLIYYKHLHIGYLVQEPAIPFRTWSVLKGSVVKRPSKSETRAPTDDLFPV